MKPEAAKRLRLLASAASVLLLLAAVAVAWIYWRVRGSLPQLEGTAAIAGLSAPVAVERDALGMPTIRGENRADLARALGWLHAQDRFFQMDTMRRAPAGELAELVGKRAIPRDRATRIHGFRKLAQAVLGRLPTEQRGLIEAYAGGVNAGLSALPEKPWEYLALREEPRRWLPEDTILIAYAMMLDLQDEDAIYERTLLTLRDKLGRDALASFAPTMTPEDAALDGTRGELAPLPSPRLIDLRRQKLGAIAPPSAAGEAFRHFARAETSLGSNAFALSGEHTASGAGLLANDMHLSHGVPNLWYRASLEYGGRKITGVSIPGTPAIIVGSNGHVAWGFTSAYVDTGDLVEVEVDTIADTLYRAPSHADLLAIEKRTETIPVKGDKPVTAEYSWTIWGPIVGTNERKQPLAHRWTAYDLDAVNFNLIDIEGVTTTRDAIAVMHRSGLPALNAVIADKAGDVAWTIAGRLPKRVGYDGRLPVSWAFGDRRWDGLLPSEEVPTLLGTDSVLKGRIWSANHRHVGGEMMRKLGDGALRRPARAAQIRDNLAAISRAAPRDLLAVQLDDRALFLERWHRLMMSVLTPEVTGAKKAREKLRGFAEKWEGRASVEAVSYRLVREFRASVYGLVFPPIFAACNEANPQFEARDLQLEGAVWAMLQEKPMHLLDSKFKSWDELLVAAIDDVIVVIDKGGVTLPQGNWGSRNRARIRHPFSYSFPWLASWIDMPDDPLPGGDDMPRVQSPGHGASERLVVSPGRENEGIFHMPGGQSAHPMSPFFRAGHEAWVRGEATPFLPGAAKHKLTLTAK